MSKQTVIVIPSGDGMAGVSTSSAKWIRRMEKLEKAGHAEEVESSVEGSREWECDKKLFRLPFFRKPREWTDEQKEAARERLAGVREAVKASRGKVAKKATAAPSKGVAAALKKGKKASAPIEEDEEIEEEEVEIEDDDLEDELDLGEEDEDEEEEIVSKPAPTSKPKAKKDNRHKHHKK